MSKICLIYKGNLELKKSTITFPFFKWQIGKKEKIAVLCEADKINEAQKSGADVVGSEDLIEKIAAGKINFTKLICTPSMMGKIGKHGKVLGPKGLMPNPK